MTRRQYTSSSNHTTSTRDSQRSTGSYESHSTAPTSFYESSRPSTKNSILKASRPQPDYQKPDLSPSTSLCSRSSVDTYSSRASLDELEDVDVSGASVDYTEIPPLPTYRHEIVDTTVRPSTPADFAALFPSMNRLSIRHDDFTSDGNMNLRVDTVVSGRRRKTIQLFHLRMHDLNKREFSLRRYCRDSGREVCNSKRRFTEPADQGRPSLQRSMSTAMKNLPRPRAARTGTAGSSSSTKSRPGTSYSAADAEEDEFQAYFSQAAKRQKSHGVATNAIKLEFSNYARVDIARCGSKGSKRYDFEWWGHKYSWKRVTDKLTNVVSFHLFRDGQNKAPVAHIVPETRSPNQVEDDKNAGGWIPPCHMWLSDEELVNAMTDVADVVVSTGLMALVDDCIKETWDTRKPRRISIPKAMDFEYGRPKAFVQHMFRRNSAPQRPLHWATPVAAY
ncbi:hypothetical protein PG994_013100 [Apiospora phragmitis]|uniref:HNH nuclease domain-containing protein n=1 Tax=Apiospora phragmitis TaxID=2905665 RepID=A0ABR1T7P4_9PEZI